MRSIRSKLTLLTVCVLTAAMLAATAFGVVTIQHLGDRSAQQTLTLLCEAGEKNLDAYFQRVEQSVSMVSAYAESDLDGLDEARLQAHLDRVSAIFRKLTYDTNDVLTYYYRIDPEVSTTAKGFWYVNQNGDGFQPHEVTDITLYDTEDTSSLVWFTIPKATGKPIWLPPYVTENLGARVISYNVPVYLKERFVGVIGIEIEYSSMARMVDAIKLYDNGYAFLNNADGELVYHPRMDLTAMEDTDPVPEGVLGPNNLVHYTYQGVEKVAVWRPLNNGMRLNVTAPVSEIRGDWQGWVVRMGAVYVVLLLLSGVLTGFLSRRLTRPLRDLTRVAEQVNEGNYDCVLNYKGVDEVGTLTIAFRQLIAHLKVYITNLNNLAYADALTSVHNKGAFDISLKKLEDAVEIDPSDTAFALCVFDCNNLKGINDRFGHDKGDIYIRSTCTLICKVFDHSPVFRLGGDEFAAILQYQDYDNRAALLEEFDRVCDEIRANAEEPWTRVDVARGMAVFDAQRDKSAEDVFRRADKQMYEHKRRCKAAARQ